MGVLREQGSNPSESAPPPSRTPDWLLPEGVDRGLWQYLHEPAIAEDYDAFFATTNLFSLDREFLLDHFTHPGRLVDLGCGTGRLSIEFATRGFEVVGVDLSESMLEVSRRKAEQSGVPVTFRKGNICDLADIPSGSFDYVISMFSTLGLIVGRAERRKAVGEMHRILRPGGLLGLHVHNRWYNAFDPQGRRWLASNLLRGLWRPEERGDKVQRNYRGIANLRIHLFSASEIRRLLRSSGLELVRMLPLAPDRKGELYRPRVFSNLRANGWLIVARKGLIAST